MKKQSRRARSDKDDPLNGMLATLFAEDQARFEAFAGRVMPADWLVQQPMQIQSVINTLVKHILQFTRQRQPMHTDLLDTHARVTKVCEDAICAVYKAGRAQDFPLDFAAVDVAVWINQSARRTGETDCMEGIAPFSQVVLQATGCKYLPSSLLPFILEMPGDLDLANELGTLVALIQAVALAIYAGQAAERLERLFAVDPFVKRLREQQQLGRALVQAADGDKDQFVKRSAAVIRNYEARH